MKAYNNDIMVEEFIPRYAKPYDPTTDNYFREPFARDVSEGKISDLFQAHSYHTKIPVDPIISYLEHYTEPGNLILDPFCGSGMTGAACIFAKRIGILSDLSPAACHIASNYCYPFPNFHEYDQEIMRILTSINEVEKYLYSTKCRKCDRPVDIAFTVWSDIFKCSRCGSEIPFITSVIPKKSGEKRTFVQCSNDRCKLIEDKTYLPYLRSDPIIVAYECSDCRSGASYERYQLTEDDFLLLSAINKTDIPLWYPRDRIDPSRELMTMGPTKRGILSVEGFYTKRNLWALAAIWQQIIACQDLRLRSFLQFTFTSIIPYVCRKQGYGGGGGGMSATLYTPSLHKKQNVFEVFRRKAKKLSKLIRLNRYNGKVIVCKASADELDDIPEECIDYIFTDPPLVAISFMQMHQFYGNHGSANLLTSGRKWFIIGETKLILQKSLKPLKIMEC